VAARVEFLFLSEREAERLANISSVERPWVRTPVRQSTIYSGLELTIESCCLEPGFYFFSDDCVLIVDGFVKSPSLVCELTRKLGK
jgi:hypothetical protein